MDGARHHTGDSCRGSGLGWEPQCIYGGETMGYLVPWAALPFQNLVQAPLSPEAPPGSITAWQPLSRPQSPASRILGEEKVLSSLCDLLGAVVVH